MKVYTLRSYMCRISSIAITIKDGRFPGLSGCVGLEAILTCLRRIRDSALAAGLLEVPIPPVVLALLVIAVVLGEVADERLLERENGIAV